MSRINVHVPHHGAYLVDDGLARGFDAEDIAHFHDGVCARAEAVDAGGVHAGA